MPLNAAKTLGEIDTQALERFQQRRGWDKR
jgi:hypothetical protein